MITNTNNFWECPKCSDLATKAQFHKEYKLHSKSFCPKCNCTATTYTLQFTTPVHLAPITMNPTTQRLALNGSWSPAPNQVTFARPVDANNLLPLICTQLLHILQSEALQNICPMPIAASPPSTSAWVLAPMALST